MLDITIKLEEPGQYQEVEAVVRAAFYREERIDKIGVGCVEHYMVHRLRQNDGIKELSFVAMSKGQVVGHVIYSHSHVLQADGTKIGTLNVGPLSVMPAYQGQGVGSSLMKYSIECARQLGYGAIIFFGHPTYYPRFGLVPADQFGITTEWGDNFPAFMAMELKKDYLSNVSGKYIESELYDEDITKRPAKEYEEAFIASEARYL